MIEIDGHFIAPDKVAWVVMAKAGYTFICFSAEEDDCLKVKGDAAKIAAEIDSWKYLHSSLSRR